MRDDELISNAMEERGGINLDDLNKDVDFVKEVKKAINLTEFKREREKAMKNITATSRTERWRAAVKWLLKHNKEANIEHRQVIAWIAEIKAEQTNKFAASEKGYFRYGMKIPGMVLDTLYLVDPALSNDTSNKVTPAEQKRVLAELMRAFPEYRVAQVV